MPQEFGNMLFLCPYPFLDHWLPGPEGMAIWWDDPEWDEDEEADANCVGGTGGTVPPLRPFRLCWDKRGRIALSLSLPNWDDGMDVRGTWKWVATFRLGL